MKKLFTAILFTLLFSISMSNASTVYTFCSFHVQDKTTKDPIVGASITIQGTSKGAITDIDGNASIDKLSPTDRFVVTYIGYSTFSDIVGTTHPTRFIIELEPDTILLP